MPHSTNMKNVIPFEKFCTCLELWKGCILAGIFAMSTSIFDLLWSIAHMIDEGNDIFFFLLFALGIESLIFIAATGVLFVALVKKSKCLLLPWLIMAAIDIVFSLVIAFAELALPSNLSSASCSLPVLSTLVTVLVCIIMIYCALIVFVQYMTFTSNSTGVGVTEIKVTPARADSTTNASGSPNRGQMDVPLGENSLKVPQTSTPKDAW